MLIPGARIFSQILLAIDIYTREKLSPNIPEGSGKVELEAEPTTGTVREFRTANFHYIELSPRYRGDICNSSYRLVGIAVSQHYRGLLSLLYLSKSHPLRAFCMEYDLRSGIGVSCPRGSTREPLTPYFHNNIIFGGREMSRVIFLYTQQAADSETRGEGLKIFKVELVRRHDSPWNRMKIAIRMREAMQRLWRKVHGESSRLR